MTDIIFIFTTVVFFALGALYATFCDTLKS